MQPRVYNKEGLLTDPYNQEYIIRSEGLLMQLTAKVVDFVVSKVLLVKELAHVLDGVAIEGLTPTRGK